MSLAVALLGPGPVCPAAHPSQLVTILSPWQLFHTFFQTLAGKVVVVELKNDLAIRGTLHSVDQYLNMKIVNCEVVEKERFPQMASVPPPLPPPHPRHAHSQPGTPLAPSWHTHTPQRSWAWSLTA